MERRREDIVEAVRERFNDRVMDIYNSLGYEDFDEIYIDYEYKVRIQRPGHTESWPLNALSTSERITLAVMLLIAGKQEYLPEYPFFVLDELVTSYDPGRFEKLKKYVSDVTDYVLITELVEDEETGGKVKIKHG